MSRKQTRKAAPPPPPTTPSRTPRAIAALVMLLLVAAAAFWYLRRDAATVPAFVKTSDQNVLLITIDTLRGDALASYGGRAATPNLDRLAQDGLRFTFAHAHAVMTLPSHASILTGRYPFDHRVRDNAGFRLADSVQTIAEAARGKGFATGAFVGAFPLDRQFGLAQGFDAYDDLGGRETGASDFSFSERPAREVVRAARAWIEQQQKPWLAWVHVFDPHSPYSPPAPYDTQYAGQLYAGEVAYTDQELGSLLDLARNAARPTTVIVTADHGEGLGDHGEATHGVFAYESTLRVPLIVTQYRPADGGRRTAGGGTTSAVPVRHVDIVPTIADLTGIEVPADLPGRTLLAAVEGESEPRPMYFEAMTAMLKRGWAPLRGVLNGRDKYIDLPLEELYDLESDPREAQNKVAASPEAVRGMRARLTAFGDTMPGEQGSENAEVRARLQSLGYLSGSAPRKAKYTEADDPKKLIEIDRLMMEGIDLHRQGRGGEAIQIYKRVIAERPDMNLAYRRLAFFQWEAGEAAAAIATLRDARAKNGPDIDVDVRLGTYLAETGNEHEAIPLLERVTKADPGNKDALNALGIAYSRGNRYSDSLRTFDAILAIDPRDSFALENLGMAHLQGRDVRKAEEAFKRALAADPRSSRGYLGLGVVAIQTGRREEAIEHFRRAVQVDPRNFDAMFNLIGGLIDAGRIAEARPYMEQFIRGAPRSEYYEKDIRRFKEMLGR